MLGAAKKNAGEYKLESVAQFGASWNAQLGGDHGFVVLVVQLMPNGQVPAGMQFAGPGVKEEVQPGGKAGAVTPSNLSLRNT